MVPFVPLRRFVADACDGPFGSAIASEHYVQAGARVIRLGNIGLAQWRDDDAVFIDKAYWRSLSRHHATTGDLVVAALGDDNNPVGRAAVVPDIGPALVKADCHRLRLRPADADPRFVAYSLSSNIGQAEALRLADGATRQRLTLGKTLSLRVPLFPVREQRAIADYLDREASQIDNLIHAKERLAGLLAEWTQGTAARVLLGTSKVGEGPGPCQVTLQANWDLVPFRWLFREVDLRSARGDETLLAVSQTRGVIPQSELGGRRQYADTLVGYKICHPGDLVVNRMWVYYGALGASGHYGLVSPDYAVFRPTASVSSAFVAQVLRTDAYVAEMTRLVRGIGAAFQGAVRKPRLHPNELGLILIPVPPTPCAQEELLARLRAREESAALTASMLQRSVELLKERRRALITAAVKGDVEVPVAA